MNVCHEARFSAFAYDIPEFKLEAYVISQTYYKFDSGGYGFGLYYIYNPCGINLDHERFTNYCLYLLLL